MHPELEKLFDLTDRVAMITGGAVNLGRDAANVLAAAGCHVVITSRDKNRAYVAAEEIKKAYNRDALALALDQSDAAQVRDVCAAAHSWKGRIDILVNNAGGGSNKGAAMLFERSPADIAKMIDVNLTGSLYCCREVGKLMAARRSGKIINIASIAGIIGRDRRMYQHSQMAGQPIDYAAAKAGILGMTRDLAAFLSPMGVHVNAISPGGFNRNLPEKFATEYADRTPLGRMGKDGFDLNGAILFLASSASDYVTGHNLIVDGGFTVWQ
jgi:NAD(P)-dependent dehydrogenase (short-subunit alcohol dehydrogenase family)